MYFPNRLELSLRMVLALPNAVGTGQTNMKSQFHSKPQTNKALPSLNNHTLFIP